MTEVDQILPGIRGGSDLAKFKWPEDAQYWNEDVFDLVELARRHNREIEEAYEEGCDKRELKANDRA
jgi:hypothetical protein